MTMDLGSKKESTYSISNLIERWPLTVIHGKRVHEANPTNERDGCIYSHREKNK